jgi:hypothetical protein
MRESEDRCKQGIAGPWVPALEGARPDDPRKRSAIRARGRVQKRLIRFLRTSNAKEAADGELVSVHFVEDGELVSVHFVENKEN